MAVWEAFQRPETPEPVRAWIAQPPPCVGLAVLDWPSPRGRGEGGFIFILIIVALYILVKLFGFSMDIPDKLFGDQPQTAEPQPCTMPRTRPLDEAYEYALSEYGNKGYAFWKELIGRGPIVISHPTDTRKRME